MSACHIDGHEKNGTKFYVIPDDASRKTPGRRIGRYGKPIMTTEGHLGAYKKK